MTQDKLLINLSVPWFPHCKIIIMSIIINKVSTKTTIGLMGTLNGVSRWEVLRTRPYTIIIKFFWPFPSTGPVHEALYGEGFKSSVGKWP